MKLSVLVPVYNECRTILEILQRIENVSIEKEIIVVDDFSTDGTIEILKKINQKNLIIIYHDKNQGKGAALRTAFQYIRGDLVVIQDADLEYSPEEFPKLLKPIIDGRADVVFGSRFLEPKRTFMFWQYTANRFLTLLTNLLYNARLTDMETCYKVFRAGDIKKIVIKSKKFDFEPEITAKFLKQKLKILEIPITYNNRRYKSGKKITWKDGLAAIYCLFKYRFTN